MKNNIFCSVNHRIVSMILAAALVATGITVTPIMQPEVVEAMSSERKITKADNATAKWIDKQLRKSNSNDIDLYVKNQKSKAATKKIMSSLQEKVSKLNSYGFTFTYKIKGYSYYSKGMRVFIQKSSCKKSDNVLFRYLDTAEGLYTSTEDFASAVDTDSYALQLDAKLKDYTNFAKTTWVVKGSKADVTQVIESLEEKIQQTNKDGVVFQYDLNDIANDKKWYVVTISKGDAKLYYYSNKFIDRVWEKAKSGVELCVQFNYAKENYTDEEWDAFFETETCQNYGKVSSLLKSNDTQRQLVINTQNFCDLSDAMKLYVISAANCWSQTAYCFDDPEYSSYPGNYIGIRYGKTHHNVGGSSWEGMQLLYEGKMVGVCHDYANAEILVAEQLGIPCYYASGSNHAWSVAKVTNSDGKVMWVVNNYGIITEMGSRLWNRRYGGLDSSVKSQIPSDHSYSITDFY